MMAASECASQIHRCLVTILNGDNASRVSAESELKGLTGVSGYAEALVSIGLDTTASIAERQIAATTLKSYVDKYWSSKQDDFIGPEPSPSAKANVKAKILLGISDDQSRIRVLMAACAAKIIHHEGPDQWPELLGSLMNNLRSRQPHQVHGAMRVFTELVDDISELEFSSIAPMLLPEIYRIFMEHGEYSPRIRARAVSILRKFCETLKSVEEEHVHAVQTYLDPILPQWMAAFQSYVTSVDTSNDTIIIKTEIFSTVERLCLDFKKRMAPYMEAMVHIAWAHIAALQENYINTTVNPREADAAYEEADSDGNVHSLESLLYSLFGIIGAASERNSLSKLFSANGQPTELLTTIVAAALLYSQITDGQIEEWNADPNVFIQTEDDSMSSFKVRQAVETLFLQLTTKHSLPTFRAMIQVSQFNFAPETAATNTSWWKIHESTLFHLAMFPEMIVEGVKKQQIQLDLGSLFDNVIMQDLKYRDFPVLQGRALSFAGAFSEALPPAYKTQYISAAVAALAPENAIPFRVCAVMAISKFAQSEDDEALSAFAAPIIGNLGNMLRDASDDALMLLLDTLTMILKINPAVSLQYENEFTPFLIEIWLKNYEDFLINATVLDVFASLASFALPQFQEKVLPPLTSTLCDPNTLATNPGLYSSAIGLLGILVKANKGTLPAVYTNQIFGSLLLSLISTDDRTIMQEGEECLKEMILKDMPTLLQWTGNGMTGLELILKYIAKLLNPQDEEPATLIVGSLITALISKGGSAIAPFLPELLTATVRRLIIPREPTTTMLQSLILVFAHLIMEQFDTTIGFLASSQIVDGKSGLEILLSSWCDHYAEFSGHKSLKLNAAAFARLVMANDARLAAVAVKGRQRPTSGIVTRSKAKTQPPEFIMVPFPVRAISLLIDDYRQAKEALARNEIRIQGIHFGEEQTEDTADSAADEDDDDEFEDIGNEAEIEYLNALVNEDDEVTRDILLTNDPLGGARTVDYLRDFFKTCWSQPDLNLASIAEQFLTDAEKKVLSGIISS